MGQDIVSSFLSALFGSKSEKDKKALLPYVTKVNELGPSLEAMTHDQLRQEGAEIRAQVKGAISPMQSEITELKERLDNEVLAFSERQAIFARIDRLKEQIGGKVEEVLQEVLPRTFALVRETARRFTNNEEIVVTATEFDRKLAGQRRDFLRIEDDKAIYINHWKAGGTEIVWNMVHYDVQIMGGVVLHEGKVAEMYTGEGKTLVATLPVFLNALPGLGVHVVTVNDYLAKRDSEWMGPIYEFHGLSVDCIDKHQPGSPERRAAYQADITFGTNNEFGFDYLRDNMAFSPDRLVQRQHNYAIVDEVDSVLIDDARTPLIISGPTNRSNDELYLQYLPDVENLFTVQQKLVTSLLNEAKKLIAEGKEAEGGKQLLRVFKGLPKYKPLIKFESEPGMKNLRLKTENLFMQENNKRMPEITEELYFVIDEKNNSVELTDKGIDLLSKRVSDHQFFILPDMGSAIAEIERSEMSESDKEHAREDFMLQYSEKAERLHIVQQLIRAYAMFEQGTQYIIQDNAVKIVDEQNGRVLEGRRYSDGLHEALEAKERVKIEAPTQTYATVTLQNYFRMYRKLAGMTGTAETEAGELWDIYKLDVVVIPTNRPVVRADYQDRIYKTNKEKFVAVVEEVQKLVSEGRPVLVGTTSVEISEMLSRYLKRQRIPHNVLNAKQHQREAEIVALAGRPGTVTIATNMAGRGTDIKLAEGVTENGGLAIIGTERHESRRVDRQLRGRAGRQGDPGSSIFFVSLEDNLMRLFGSDRMARVMDRFGHKPGEMIQHSWISKSIERAQKKVEQNNFGIRKRLLEYDDVMNLQRERIYGRRRNALYGQRLEEDVEDIILNVAEGLAAEWAFSEDYADFNAMILRTFALTSTISEENFKQADEEHLRILIQEMLSDRYLQRMQTITARALPVLNEIVEKEGDRFKNVIVPMRDGELSIEIGVDIQRCISTEGRELIKAIAKTVILAEIDDHWQQHLLAMDELKQSVQNASYEQKDPLVIYKFEAYGLFERMWSELNHAILQRLLRIHLPDPEPSRVRHADLASRQKKPNPKLTTGRAELPSGRPQQPPMGGESAEPNRTPVRREPKVGRNEPCPCGSGKKYKQCCGKLNA